MLKNIQVHIKNRSTNKHIDTITFKALNITKFLYDILHSSKYNYIFHNCIKTNNRTLENNKYIFKFKIKEHK